MFHDLSIRDLEAVAAVASHGHFGRAADGLRIAQPTLSAQVRKVERALGADLFERGARRFIVTPEGEKVLPLVHDMLAAAQRLETASRAGWAAEARPLRLGVIPTLGPYLMPHLLRELRRDGREQEVRLTELQTAGLIDAIREGALDAGLLSLPIRQEAVECVPVFDEPFRLIAPAGSEILDQERLTASRLRACDMVLLEEGHCLREQALSVCGKRGGVKPRLVATSLETLKYLVAAGEGYSLLPELACGLNDDLSALVRLRGFDERPLSRRIGLCFRRTSARRGMIVALAGFIRRHRPAGLRAVGVTAMKGGRGGREDATECEVA